MGTVLITTGTEGGWASMTAAADVVSVGKGERGRRDDDSVRDDSWWLQSGCTPVVTVATVLAREGADDRALMALESALMDSGAV